MLRTPIEEIFPEPDNDLFQKYPVDQILKKNPDGRFEQNYIYDYPNMEIPSIERIPIKATHIPTRGQSEIHHTPRVQEHYTKPISCAEFYEHIHTCPVCSKLYTFDKTPYYIVIVLLSIIIILLLKHILEK